jgi:hypothetical protein
MESKITNVTLSFEHIAFEWLNYKDAMKRLTFKNARDVLQKADEFIKNKK